MSVRTIHLHDSSSITELAHHLGNFETDEKATQSIIDAVEILKNYRETVELSPYQISLIFNNLKISDSLTPSEMNDNLCSGEKAFVIRKKFFDSRLVHSKLETTLLEIVSELALAVSGDILHAIVSLVQNFSAICLECQGINTIYRELCFKFFCRDDIRDEILILIINIDYGLKQDSLSCLWRALNFLRFGLHLSFFGAVVKTSIVTAAKTDLNDQLNADEKSKCPMKYQPYQ